MSDTNLKSYDEESLDEEEAEKLSSKEDYEDDYELHSSTLIFSEEDEFVEEDDDDDDDEEGENKNEIDEEEDEEGEEEYSEEEIKEDLISKTRHIKIQETTTKEKAKIKIMEPSIEQTFRDRSSPGSTATTMSKEEHSEEQSGESQINVEEFLDRDTYLDMYQKLLDEKKVLRRKNAYLHRKMSEHLKKRNLESLMKEPTNVDSAEIQEKYERKLRVLADRIEWHAVQKEKLGEELHLMRKQVEDEQSILDSTFQDFLAREREVSTGLIDTSTGKPISERVINRLLNLQKQKLETIGHIRLGCLRLRDKVAIKEKILEGIETLGDNLHLVDYEHLRIENQNYINKNEERDEELSKLHNKSTASIQVLAHIRQKSYATAVDFQVMEEKLKAVETNLSETRENLNLLKMQRDNYRSEAVRLKESSGLLTQTKLLQDFERTNIEILKAREELDAIKINFENEKQELLQLQSLLNIYEEEKKLESDTAIANTQRRHSQIEKAKKDSMTPDRPLI